MRCFNLKKKKNKTAVTFKYVCYGVSKRNKCQHFLRYLNISDRMNKQRQYALQWVIAKNYRFDNQVESVTKLSQKPFTATVTPHIKYFYVAKDKPCALIFCFFLSLSHEIDPGSRVINYRPYRRLIFRSDTIADTAVPRVLTGKKRPFGISKLLNGRQNRSQKKS